ncbi:phosphatase PAP2 family protein [Streptomyces sp. CAU 1734]|uniref:phosphatase PAP2 family protein n=1 Tax=Streptomyces sp. CAU 1734 TaxID=3140360 RepID=UPI003260A85C
MDSSITADLYRDITDFADSTPAWFQLLARLWTEGGLLLFGVLLVVVWWRARGGGTSDIALAVLAPLATAAGYVVSESVKTVFDEERPCRALDDAPAPLLTCPPTGDWSFPSNHAAIAGAAAVAIVLAWRRLAPLIVPMALLMAFSRVFVGVHYPHDVLVGMVVGGLVAAALMFGLGRPARSLLAGMRASRSGPVAWFAGPGPRTGARTAAPAG